MSYTPRQSSETLTQGLSREQPVLLRRPSQESPRATVLALPGLLLGRQGLSLNGQGQSGQRGLEAGLEGGRLFPQVLLRPAQEFLDTLARLQGEEEDHLPPRIRRVLEGLQSRLPHAPL